MSKFKLALKTARNHLKLLIVVLLITIAGVILFIPKTKTAAIQLAQVKRQDIKAGVSASGILTGKNTANLKFKLGGKLAYLNVQEGDSISAGQVIATLDTQDLSIALQQAKNNLTMQQANLDSIYDDLKGHNIDETFPQRQTRTQAETAKNNAVDAVKAAERAFQDANLISPIDGTVTQVGPITGQVVSSTELVAQIVDWSSVYFDADIDEADISKVSLNQPAEVRLDAYPDQTFAGTVEQINPITKTTSSGSTVVTTRINLQKLAVHPIGGLNGQANIIISQTKNVLTIPIDALADNNTVYLKTPSGYQLVKVETGLKSDTDVEIVSGLSEGQQVVKNPSTAKIPSQNPLVKILNRVF